MAERPEEGSENSEDLDVDDADEVRGGMRLRGDENDPLEDEDPVFP